MEATNSYGARDPRQSTSTSTSASTRLMNESAGQSEALGSISLFPELFRAFFFFAHSPRPRRARISLRGADRVRGSRARSAGKSLFPLSAILKHRDYTIRGFPNLIENEGATLIYGSPRLIRIYRRALRASIDPCRARARAVGFICFKSEISFLQIGLRLSNFFSRVHARARRSFLPEEKGTGRSKERKSATIALHESNLDRSPATNKSASLVSTAPRRVFLATVRRVVRVINPP